VVRPGRKPKSGLKSKINKLVIFAKTHGTWEITEFSPLHQCYSRIGVYPAAEFEVNKHRPGRHDPADSARFAPAAIIVKVFGACRDAAIE
jgi:hypothetical protein